MLEKRKLAKEYTWKVIMDSATVVPTATHVGSSMRLLAGSLGFHARPMKTARVKMELTWTIPSRAVMWTLVAKDLVAGAPVVSIDGGSDGFRERRGEIGGLSGQLEQARLKFSQIRIFVV